MANGGGVGNCSCFKLLRAVIFGGVVVLLCFAAWLILGEWVVDKSAQQAKLHEGLSASGSFFAAIAVVIALYSIFKQQQYMLSQENSMSRQHFEVVFWNLIEKLDAIAKASIRYQTTISGSGKKEETFHGLAAFKETNHLLLRIAGYKSLPEDNETYEKMLYHRREDKYLAVLYAILQRVDTDWSLSDDEKFRYFSVLFSCLSEVELTYIAIYIATEKPGAWQIGMANRLGMFKTVPLDLIPESIRAQYEPSAFGVASWPEPSSTPPP